MTPSKSKPTEYAEVEAALGALQDWRAEDRAEWIRIGQALHDFDRGDSGMDLWDAFSRRSEKYKPGEIERIWRGFRPAKGITVATLFAAAQEDGWRREDGRGDSPPPQHRPSGRKPAKAQSKAAPSYLWQSPEEAREALAACPRVCDHIETLEWLGREYGLDPDLFLIESWHCFQHPTDGPGIVYEARTPEGTPCWKFKSLRRDERGKRQIVTLHGAGGGALVFERPGNPLVIVAGEEKAAAAYHAGLFGVLSPITGESALSEGWIKWLLDHKEDYDRVILANDNDKAGKDANRKSAEALARAGWPRTRIHALAWPEGLPAGYDLNDALKDGLDLAHMLEQAPCAFPRRSLLNVRQLLELQLPDDDNLLGDRMLAEGELMALIGMGGIGKSRLVLQLALSSIMGWDWLGLRTHATGRRWLIFQTENSARRLARDLRGMTRGWSRDQLDYLSQRLFIQANLTDADMVTALSDETTVQALAGEVAHYQPDVVVFDPLTEFYAGEDENQAMQMRETLSAIRRIVRASGPKAAAIVVHHARGGRAAAAGAVGFDRSEFGRGSKALYNSVRAQVNVALGSEDEDNPPLVVACGKNNNGARFEPLAVRLDMATWLYQPDETFDWDAWEDTVNGKKKKSGAGSGGRSLRVDQSSILCRITPGQEVKQSELVREITEATGAKRTAIQEKIRQMLDAGELVGREVSWRNGFMRYLSRGGNQPQ